MTQINIETPNGDPFGQNAEIAGHAIRARIEDPSLDPNSLTFDVTYPDRDTGEIGKGHTDRVTVNHLGVVIEAINVDPDNG